MSNVYRILARVAIMVVAASFFLVLRPDLAGAMRLKMLTLESPGIIDEYVRTHPVRKLQIGAGPNNKPGWFNTDIESTAGQAYLDASKPFRLHDRSLDYVYSGQVIEYLTFEEGLVMLKESYRVLAPGGRVRLPTPDLTKLLSHFQENKTKEMQQFIIGIDIRRLQPPEPECYILNRQMRDFGHQFLYITPKLLRSSLETTDFKNIKQVMVGESEDPVLKNAEQRSNWREKDLNAFEAMNFEAVRE